jgi:hypothetical protein
MRRLAALAAVLSIIGAGAAPALAAGSKSGRFRAQVGRAMGLVPAVGHDDLATGINFPAVYHGGTVMAGKVTVHTVFWAPAGYRFDGSPGPGIPGYIGLNQQFLGDVAHDSGSTSNAFSVLDQYGQNGVSGGYDIAYDPAADSIADTDPYPRRSAQCPSPSGTITCVTDPQIQAELSHVIATQDPSGVGLHDVWEIFLPPNVDECITAGVCGTNAFAGYHSLAATGGHEYVYAVIIDPLIEQPPIDGFDPQGNPEAEATIDTVAHETVEAITDPEGVGWMDSNGYEVGDKCENGPQEGTPLGYAPDGAPYNQVINGHQYAIQTMWSNDARGCVQASTASRDGLPLPVVDLRQFSSAVSGNAARARAGIAVHVTLLRGFSPVAQGSGATRADGAWGPILLRGSHGALHAVGDDRDAIVVSYGRGGPGPDLIATGSGGDPFSESGWTTWLDLDHGIFVDTRSVSVMPCGQVGVLTIRVNGRATASPLPFCQNQTDAARVATPYLSDGSRLQFTSEDNRAPSPLAYLGALVSMTISPGEPDSVGPVNSAGPFPFLSSGVPTCSVELRRQTASCSGLQPGSRYQLRRARGGARRFARADGGGVARFSGFPGQAALRGGDLLALRNGAGRVLTVLHIAHLRVSIKGNETLLSGGTCQPGDYYGKPFTHDPYSSGVGNPGATGLGVVCPDSGRARGLSTGAIAQTDDRSGGVTWTSLPQLTGEAPGNDAIVYGGFIAVAQTGITGAHGAVYSTGATVSLSIADAHGRTVYRTGNVGGGVHVGALPSGVYRATWVVRDVNGDTRTVLTRFVES